MQRLLYPRNLPKIKASKRAAACLHQVLALAPPPPLHPHDHSGLYSYYSRGLDWQHPSPAVSRSFLLQGQGNVSRHPLRRDDLWPASHVGRMVWQACACLSCESAPVFALHRRQTATATATAADGEYWPFGAKWLRAPRCIREKAHNRSSDLHRSHSLILLTAPPRNDLEIDACMHLVTALYHSREYECVHPRAKKRLTPHAQMRAPSHPSFLREL